MDQARYTRVRILPLERYLTLHGRPAAFYSDQHSVFRVAQQGARTGHGMTQFGRALNELNIAILCANASQAKGRVERANRTLQDRLVKELRLAGISDRETANAFLPGFLARHNAQFGPAAPPCGQPASTAECRTGSAARHSVLSRRTVCQQPTGLLLRPTRIILVENEITRDLPGKYVDSHEGADGRLEFRWKGVSLPCSVFDKDQRVTHAAMTETKHLGAVLEYITAGQDKAPPKVHRAGRATHPPNAHKTPQQRLELAGRARGKGPCRSTPGMTLSRPI
jgi:hypothetical protein